MRPWRRRKAQRASPPLAPRLLYCLPLTAGCCRAALSPAAVLERARTITLHISIAPGIVPARTRIYALEDNALRLRLRQVRWHDDAGIDDQLRDNAATIGAPEAGGFHLSDGAQLAEGRVPASYVAHGELAARARRHILDQFRCFFGARSARRRRLHYHYRQRWRASGLRGVPTLAQAIWTWWKQSVTSPLHTRTHPQRTSRKVRRVHTCVQSHRPSLDQSICSDTCGAFT